MLLKKLKIKYPKLLERFSVISYRLPLQVKEVVVFESGCCYPRCPRCYQSIEREYMLYCDRCGQKLDWQRFDYADICKVVL